MYIGLNKQTDTHPITLIHKYLFFRHEIYELDPHEESGSSLTIVTVPAPPELFTPRPQIFTPPSGINT